MPASRQGAARWSLEWKLPIMVGGVLLAVTAALCWGAYVEVSRSVELAAAERLSGVAAQMVVSARTSSAQLWHVAAAVGAEPTVRAWLAGPGGRDRPGPDTTAIRTHFGRDTSVVAIEFLDADHRSTYSYGPAADRVKAMVGDDLGLAASDKDSAFVGRFHASGDAVFFPAIASVSDHGHRLGYVMIWHRATNGTRAEERMAGLTGGRGGTILIGSTPGAWTDQATAVEPPPVVAGPAHTARYRRGDGGERLAAIAPVGGTPWLVAVELPRDVVLAPARRFVANFALIALAVLALGLGGAWLLSRHVTRPLIRLTSAADAIRAGDHTARVEIQRHDETGRLGTAFNHMLDRIADEANSRIASEEQWRSLFEQNPHPMWLFDMDTLAVLRVNEAAVRQYGYSREEFAGLSLAELRPKEDRDALHDYLKSIDPDALTAHVVRHRRKDGSTMQVEVRGRPLAIPGHPRARLVTATDVTERSVLEEQLRQSQKMEAIGRLAGGVAHDFNNLLTVIGGYSEQLVASADLGADDRASVAEIAAAASRAAALTRQLLMFSRKQIVQHRLLDLNDVVVGLGPMLRRLLFENIELVTRLEPGPAPVVGDLSQLEQVIVNLAVNAADAMPNGGTLAIETATVELDSSYAMSHAEVSAGRYVQLVVSDTGIGMDADTLGKIFEPFFTTKAIGHGTGLGLATVYAVAKQLGGHVWVYSEPGQGATFKVYIPYADSAAAGSAMAAAPAGTAPVKAGTTVLLVEDEVAVRHAARRMLERSGYSVLEASDGRTALDLMAGHSGTIHAVVTDLMMPGMDGRSFAERLRTLEPGLPVIFISGYTNDAAIRRGIVDSRQSFLQKPFTRDQLAQAVAAAVSART